MKRNTYVTAGLFILFGLLTITYWQWSDREDPEIPIVGSGNPINDVAAIGDLIDAEVEAEDVEDSDVEEEVLAEVEDAEETDEDAEAMADAEDAEDAGEDAEVMAEAQENEDETDADESSGEVISRIDALRASMEEGRTQQVTALTDIIASSEYDAMMKSAAKDTLNELQALATSSRMLETVITHMGFDDVLVNATTDSVRVTIQVGTLADVPSRDELAELYILAGIEFGSHRNGNISIDFQPLN